MMTPSVDGMRCLPLALLILVISLGEGRLLASLTMTMAPLGAISLGAVAMLVFTVAVLAMVAPAASALRIAPMQVLREE